MIGQTVSHYKILEELGGGGMGVVYKAEDIRLGRNVALKFLPEKFAENHQALERFQIEARTASALNHPNICIIYDIGEHEGQPFIVMEYLEGQPLLNLLHDKPLPTDQLLKFGIQIAEALEAAHSKGIIHRDIKPANVFVTASDSIKLLDFGLAKLAEAPHDAEGMDTRLTAVGMAVGTPYYMSPEQLMDQEVDPRSDLFSFGVLLYEMATATLPFTGKDIKVVFNKILNSAPLSLSQSDPSCPAELDRLVQKSLEKDRDVRYQTASDLKADLKRIQRQTESGRKEPVGVHEQPVQTVAESKQPGDVSSDTQVIVAVLKRRKKVLLAAACVLILLVMGLYRFRVVRPFRPPRPVGGEAITSVAVLPFENMSNDPEMEYLSDGTAQSIIYGLSKLPQVRVVSFSSVLPYKGQTPDTRKIARDLRVRAVLRGWLNQQGDNLFVNVELVDTMDNSVLWGQQFNQKVTELLDVQEQIAMEVSDNLRWQLTGEEERMMTKRYTENTEAYRSYLEGRYHWNKRTEEGFERALELFNEAVDQDPGYALAYTGLADTYFLLTGWQHRPPSEMWPLVISAVSRALAIDDTLAEAHASLGVIRAYHDWDWESADAEYRRAIELNANYATAHHWRGLGLAIQGRLEEGLEEARKAQTLDPLSLIINTDLGRVLMWARQYDDAIEQLNHTLEINPDFSIAHEHLTWVYSQIGMYEQAIVHSERWSSLENRYLELPTVLRYLLAGNRVEAKNLVGDADGYWSLLVYPILDENDLAFDQLRQLVETQNVAAAFAAMLPQLDPLRDDPRFQDLLRRMNLEP
jgi:serine/threonine protein kinase/Tfp pilus assembly protein PilF